MKFEAKDWQLVLVNPRIHVSTADAFAAWDKIAGEQDILTKLGERAKRANSMWHDTSDIESLHLDNDLETPVFSMHPQLALLKADILKLGAAKAAMSGSGSTIFGLFSDTATASHAAVSLRRKWPLVYHVPLRNFGM